MKQVWHNRVAYLFLSLFAVSCGAPPDSGTIPATDQATTSATGDGSPGERPTDFAPASSMSSLAVNSLAPMVTESGFITASIDGLGTNQASGVIQVDKPAGATVRSAWLAAASTGFSNRQLVNGDVKLDGQSITWTRSVQSSISSWNHWANVTSLVKPKVDASAPGRVNFTVTEVSTLGVEGEILAVIFDNPAATTTNTVILLFGAQNIAGDTFNIALADPINKNDPNLGLDLSLGISFGFQSGSPVVQYSTVDVNGQRLTTLAGGQDDGEPANGALLTVGGLDDTHDNPPPFATGPGPRGDDELYDLRPFVNNGDRNISFFTKNPSNDDNIFFAALMLNSAAAVVGEGVVLGPSSASGAVGLPHTVTATLQNDLGQPITNRLVTFQVLSGPNAGVSGTATSDGTGHASFTYVGSQVAGRDQIQASFVKSNGQIAVSNIALKDWTIVSHPPLAVCRNLNLVANATCGASGSVDNGSSDPDNNLAGCTQSPAGPYGLGTTHVTLTCTDTTGLSSSCAADVTVVDTSAPAISCPADATAECTSGSATVNPGHASATDNCGTANVSEPGAGSYPLGTTSVTHHATDSSGNSASCTNRVIVSDTLAPSVTLVGAASQTLECNASSYSEAGATAADQCAGNVTSRVTISGSVNTGAVGTYALSYRASDPSGNVSAPVVRTVTVRDTLAPSISCPAPQVAECVGGGALVAPGQALASDVCALGSVTQYPPAVYPLGTTPLSYAAIDKAGNASSCSSSITVTDTQAPALALNGSQAVTLECGSGPYVDPGATASDVCAGNLPVSASGSVNTGAPGSYAVSYSAVDPAGNSAGPITRVVNVQDTLAPSLTVSASPAVLWPPDGELHPIALSAIAGDSCDQNVAVSCTATSNQPAAGPDPDIVWDHGNLSLRSVSADLGVGRVYTITCTATDHSGNTTTRSTDVIVQGPAPLITLCNKDLYTNEPAQHVGAYVTASADGAAILNAYFTVNGGAPIPVTPRYPDGSLGTDITLQEGTNVIQLTATDSYGATTTATQTLVLDTVAPVISFISPAMGATFSSTLIPTNIAVGDQTPTTLTVQEVFSTDFPSGSGTFGPTVDVVNTGYQSVWATATDAAGNTTEAWVDIFILDSDSIASGNSSDFVAPLRSPLAKPAAAGGPSARLDTSVLGNAIARTR